MSPCIIGAKEWSIRKMATQHCHIETVFGSVDGVARIIDNHPEAENIGNIEMRGEVVTRWVVNGWPLDNIIN